MLPLKSVRLIWRRINERLWVRPLAVCALSVLAVFFGNFLDGTGLKEYLPEITTDAVEAVLSIMTASMLVIATFAVGAMVSAYASASTVATPRSFSLVVADDVSQNALSVFVGAFIFSTVALVASKSGLLESAGRFAIFAMAVIAFAAVIFLFVRWVDRIARLGRVGETIKKVEEATTAALKRRSDAPTLKGVTRGPGNPKGQPVYAKTVGYVQHIDVEGLQIWAKKTQNRVTVESLPGTFVTPDRPLAYVTKQLEDHITIDVDQVAGKFIIGIQRQFDDDPRFGLIVMSQIASRALSPALNDPGTAIDVIGSLVRVLVLWNNAPKPLNTQMEKYDGVEVPRLEVHDMFDDAFTAISRDGASFVEVALRLQKALRSLAAVGDASMRNAALQHSRLALARAELALQLPEDLKAVRAAATIAKPADNTLRERD